MNEGEYYAPERIAALLDACPFPGLL